MPLNIPAVNTVIAKQKRIGKLNDTYLGKLKFDGNSLLLAMEF